MAAAVVHHRDTLGGLRQFVQGWAAHASTIADALDEQGTGQTHGAALVLSTVVDAPGDPTAVFAEAAERASVTALVATENPAFSKLAAALTYLVCEVGRLVDDVRARFLPALLVFGEGTGGGAAAAGGEREQAALAAALAGALGTLQDTLACAAQLRRAALTLFRQLAALYADKQRAYAPLRAVRLGAAFASLSDALAAMHALDEGVRGNAALPAAFALLRACVEREEAAGAAGAEAGAVGLGSGACAALDAALSAVEAQLLPAAQLEGLLAACAAGAAAADGGPPGAPAPKRLCEELASAAAGALEAAAAGLTAGVERPRDREEMLGGLCLAALSCRLQPLAPDKRVVAAAVAVARRCPLLPAHPHLLVVPVELLQRTVPAAALPPELADAAATDRAEALAALDGPAGLAREVAVLGAQLAAWLARADSAMGPAAGGGGGGVALGMRLRLLVQGLFLAARVRAALQTTLHLHVACLAPMPPARLRQLVLLAEQLKAVEAAYARRASATALVVPHLLRFTAARVAKALGDARDALAPGSKQWAGRGAAADGQRLDALAAVALAQRCLGGPPTRARRAALRTCMDTLRDARALEPDAAADCGELLTLRDLLAELRPLGADLCDCGFLLFSRELLPAALSDLFTRPAEAHRLPRLLRAFGPDAEALLRRGGAPRAALAAHAAEVREVVMAALVRPLCAEVEMDLRLHLHSARLAGAVEVCPARTGVRDLAPFLAVGPLRLGLGADGGDGGDGGDAAAPALSLEAHVAHHLNAAFHNHCAVALHDWKTYGEMRCLAKDKYGLRLAEVALPGQTLEQGLDVLEIMRNIHLFVARFTYNMNMQMFVERPAAAAERKHLNVVAVRHVANSIRTHGTGIMNTTVNFVYQFLAQKLQTASQFLFDDIIRSRLLKETRFVAEATRPRRDTGGATAAAAAAADAAGGQPVAGGAQQIEYPVERAVRFNRDIRKLGVTEDGATFLDHFRVLITEVGNALGFVRMVRLGAMHFCNDAAKFVPDVSHARNFADEARAQGLSAEAAAACGNLDAVLENLRANTAETTDYFKVLVSVFSSELAAAGHEHMREFWAIVPALSMCYCDAAVAAKDRLGKRGRDGLGAGFTDDGFALGVAFLLRVLRQDKQYDQLHWATSLEKHHTAERARLGDEAARASGVADTALKRAGSSLLGGYGAAGGRAAAGAGGGAKADEGAQALEIRQGRAAAYLEEAKLLQFSLSGARTFFRQEA